MEMETENRKRSMDKRRETSRCAARERRGKESEVFDDLKEVVPLVDDGTVGHLDRIALLRVAATVCRFRCHAANVLDNLVIPDIASRKQNLWTEDTMTECLDGFVIMSDCDGNVFYITESVALYLGLTQTDIAGRSLKEFLHLDDYNEFRDIVGQLITRSSDETQGRAVVLRMKTVISPRGRNLNMKSALYKPVSFVIRSKKADVGNVVFMQGVCVPAGQGSVNANATALTKGSDTPSGTYMTRHTCDMRISFISERFNYMLKSDLKSLVGVSYYDLVHPGDIELIAKSMKELFTKGHVRTPYYRLVAANGNFAWLMTDANITQHTCKGQRGQYVVCVHYIIGVQEPTESLVVCTDSAPAGLPVEVKKEIDDLREYVGRQPEVIDADNFVPLFADDSFCVTETLRPQENGAPPARRSDSYDEVLEWLYDGQPPSPRSRAEECRPSSDPTLASAQLMAQPSRSSYGSTYPYRSEICQGSEGPYSQRSGTLDSRTQEYPGAGTHEAYMFDGGRSLPSSTATNTPPSLSAVHSPDHNSLPSCKQRTNPTLFSPMLTANSTTGPASIMPDLSTTIVEDLRWEEPDLTGLAPFVPDDDVIDFGAESLPKDLEMLFSDMPQWRAAQPMVARGNPTSQRVKYEAPLANYDYQTRDASHTDYQSQSSQQQYWQQQNWAPSNNYTY